MTWKRQNYRPQTNQRHRYKETQNTDTPLDSSNNTIKVKQPALPSSINTIEDENLLLMVCPLYTCICISHIHLII